MLSVFPFFSLNLHVYKVIIVNVFTDERTNGSFLVSEARLKARQSKSAALGIKYVMLKYSYS